LVFLFAVLALVCFVDAHFSFLSFSVSVSLIVQGYHGESSDGVHRNFDRKQGAHGKHAPGEARKDGAVGEVDPSQFQGSSSDFAAQDAAQVADANGDIVGDMILDVTPMAADPDDSKMTYDEYLAQ